MNKLLIVRAAATTALALSLTAGVAAADASVSNTGFSSHNSVSSKVDNSQQVQNENSADLGNQNSQNANSGKADTSKNTTAGDATSGDVTNTNGLNVGATIDNTGADSGLAGDSSD